MKYLVSITFLILSQLMAQPNQSNIPLNLSYQGLVTQTDGSPFEDGEYLMTFRLYVENENGEDQLMWEEEHSVQLSQGVFSAVLGSIVDLPDNIPSHAVLETQVNDDILNPRQPFTSVPFALKSNRSNMAINAMYSDSSLTSEFALHSITADTANFVLNAPSADIAQFAHHASQADHALAADSAGVSETALFANSAAEAGSLENVITTPDELNYVSGVTSSIQEQLDSKGTGSVNTLLDLGITNTPEVLNSVSGINTGDQDITGITDNANNIATNASNIETNTDAITLNTVKVGITPEQADAIVANTAKVGITTDQANAITANTAKVGVPTAYTLSETDGTSGQVLSTDGAGNVSWSNPAVDTDTQDLSLSGNTISLVDGGIVDVSTITAVAANTAKVGVPTAYTLPSADGSSSQVLSTDGSGSVSWSSVSITEVADEFSATTSQTSFTLTQTPSSNSKVKMFINGIRISNSAYSISGTTLTYISSSNGSYSLVSGDRIQFDYHY